MRGIRKGLKYMAIALATLFFVWISVYESYAAEETEQAETGVIFRQAVADENKLKVYIRGADAEENLSYQIGSIPVESMEVYRINEDRKPVHTLIMLDNSVSIPAGSRDKIKELMSGIVDAHTEKEEFRIAIFSDKIDYLSDTYSNDYTVLKNAIASIKYNDQETYLTDVLYDLVDDLNKDAYMGYTRVIVISDGVDNKQLGVTREELNLKLKETPYPIYTVGTSTGKNNDQLENMFALSRLSKSEYCILEESQTAEIFSSLSKDANMIVVEAQIPEDAKVGGRQSSKLLFSDGTQLVFDVHMPFHVKAKQEEPTVKPEPSQEPPTTEVMEAKEKEGIPAFLLIGILAGIVAVAVIVIVVILLMRKKKVPSETGGGSDTVITADTEETVRINDDGGGILPPSGRSGRIKYRVTLINKTDMSRTYQCELKNSISLGKVSGNDIVVNAGTVSKRHCMITNKNGRLFIQDLNSTNGTFVNNERINFETEIFSGTTIRMGREELIAKFEQV